MLLITPIKELIEARLPDVTPVTCASTYVESVGAVLLPVYALMIASAASRVAAAATAFATTAESSVKASTPVPLSAVAAMAARTSARFALVTPVRPIVSSAAGVNAGDAVWPAAVAMIPATVSASADNSARVSTDVSAAASSTSLRSAAFAALSICVRPSVAY